MDSSGRPGMGAIPYAGGVTFRVWAPFAAWVAVAGEFNNWDVTAHVLARDGASAYWSGDVPGASLGQQYMFVMPDPNGGQPLWRKDPYGREVTNSAGHSIVANTEFAYGTPGYSSPPWNELVIYELHVGSFLFDPQSRNGRGDFKTVINYLPYLADLGVNAIQLLPAAEFPGYYSEGYNPSDIFAIESDYGGPTELQSLIEAAHANDLAVLFDVVYNHFGPDDLSLWQFDGWHQPDSGGIYFYDDYRAFTPWGARNRPDYGRGEVRQFIRDNALYWLTQHHFDGLRWDATNYIRNVYGSNSDWTNDIPAGRDLMRWINREIQDRQPWKISIAEDMQDNEFVTRGLAGEGLGFTSQWGAGFMHTLRDMVCRTRDEYRDMDALADSLEQRFNGDAFRRVVYTESHDEVKSGTRRVPDAIAPGNADGFYAQKRSTLAAALVFTAPGIPMIFMGQEFLEWEPWSDGMPLDWSKAFRFAGIRSLYRDLIRLRRNWFDTTRGLSGQGARVFHKNNWDKVLAMHRWRDGGPRDDVVVVANCADREYNAYWIGLPRGGRWRVRFNGDYAGYSSVFANHRSDDVDAVAGGSDQMPFAAPIGLGRYTAIILSQDE